MRQPAKKATRIFVERYGEITDLYMPKVKSILLI